MTRVAIALGSNLGDRQQHLQFGIDELTRLLNDVRAASFVETDAVDVVEPQPAYLNTAVIGTTPLAPAALLAELLAIEQRRGRTRPSLRAARTLDLDLILYGDVVVDTPTLTVPHPRF